jgi:mono/diheme cytochrome c family protein
MYAIRHAAVRAAASILTLAIALTAAPAWGAAPDIARKYCANCHIVAAGAQPRNQGAHAPSFRDIANDPARGNTENLALVLSQQHAGMPPFALSAGERRSLIGYIGSFRTLPD